MDVRHLWVVSPHQFLCSQLSCWTHVSFLSDDFHHLQQVQCSFTPRMQDYLNWFALIFPHKLKGDQKLKTFT